ncbi:DUF397 domain-containing protein [Actinospica durhamensis]|uniref:DUF397 domain-containing protein n=1 Tax=Actinospica durhamensis TaxID=1508375 RepID=A0A941IWM5_9ACTN|nr:DUF397 domain-containing protein [Actinospica durhamensis]MBR7839666.1 DUF397 domain-containing protein [Actinospica durhamensis]
MSKDHDGVMEAGWRKSSYSNGQGNCVEFKQEDGLILVRDSKQGGTGPVLRFTHAEVGAFLLGAKDGEFDDLAKE